MDNRIDIEKGYFCKQWPKCINGRSCPARFDQKIIQESRNLWFKKRVQIKLFEKTPDCMNEI